MPNSPIQVVLDANNFIFSREKFGGDAHKDFYASGDNEGIRRIAVSAMSPSSNRCADP